MFYFSTDNDDNHPNLAPIDKELLKKDVTEENDEDELAEIPHGKPVSQRDLRSLAFHLVYAADRSDYTLSLDELFADFNEHYELQLTPHSFAYTLAQGAIDNRDSLDEEIKPLLKNWTFERLGCCTRLILRMALWELQQPNSAPIVAINEAIELAKGFAEKDAYKFVNGLLDEYCKINNLKRDEEI
jgi:N utilization substance protein B